MAEYTDTLGLIKPGQQDRYTVADMNENSDILDTAIAELTGAVSAIREALGGISVIRTDQAAYDSEEHSSDILYLCADTGHIYLGDTQMGGGGGGFTVGAAVLRITGAVGTAGNAEEAT